MAKGKQQHDRIFDVAGNPDPAPAPDVQEEAITRTLGLLTELRRPSTQLRSASLTHDRAPDSPPTTSIRRACARSSTGLRIDDRLRPAAFGATRMRLAGHIKPWKDSTPAERLDPCNGLAACPAHDVAFDTGLLTAGGLRIHPARPLAGDIQADPLARQYYGRPPMRETILLPEGAQPPAASTSTGTATRSSSPESTPPRPRPSCRK
jgi:hypothetical protein